MFVIQRDNYFLQALGWTLAEYGDSLQSLVATKLEKQIHSMYIFPWETLSLRKYSSHYISTHYHWKDFHKKN